MTRFVRYPESTQKRNEWKRVKCCKVVKRTAWFSATIVTNNSGKCLTSLLATVLQFQRILLLFTYTLKQNTLACVRILHKIEYARYVSSSLDLSWVHYCILALACNVAIIIVLRVGGFAQNPDWGLISPQTPSVLRKHGRRFAARGARFVAKAEREKDEKTLTRPIPNTFSGLWSLCCILGPSLTGVF